MSIGTSAEPNTSRLVNRASIAAVVGALVLILVALAGYAVGVQHGNRTHALTGDFYVGLHEASGRVDGWGYGLTGTVAWVDNAGSLHEDGWPACLDTVGSTMRITFGEISVTGPHGVSWRSVEWVDCRTSQRIR